MSTASGQLAISTTAVNVPAGLTPAVGLGGLVTFRLKNSGANPVQLGNSAVTTSNGYTMAAGDVQSFDLEGDDTLYAVSALGSTLQVFATGKEIGG